VQDDTPLDIGVNSNGWILNLTLASPVGGAADNQLLMTNQAAQIPSGSNAVYYLAVTNWGPSPATNVIVSDTLPSPVTVISASATLGSINSGGTSWNVGLLATNAAGTQITVLATNTGGVLTLTVQPLGYGPFFNFATVNADTPDPNPADASASATVTVTNGAPPQLSGTVVAANGQLQFTIISPAGQTNIIEATTNLAAGPWFPIYTNLGSFIFTNSYLTNYPDVFFRDRVGP
jgi:uncharacterized repeat protein (TIGR01451 family)